MAAYPRALCQPMSLSGRCGHHRVSALLEIDSCEERSQTWRQYCPDLPDLCKDTHIFLRSRFRYKTINLSLSWLLSPGNFQKEDSPKVPDVDTTPHDRELMGTFIPWKLSTCPSQCQWLGRPMGLGLTHLQPLALVSPSMKPLSPP